MRLLTWNTEGVKADSILIRIREFKPDVVCIQECGALLEELGVGQGELAKTVEAHIPAAQAGAKPYKIAVHTWDRTGGAGGGNIRCSMAMIYTDDYNIGQTTMSNDDYKRSVMHVTNQWTMQRIYNIHAGGKTYIEEVLTMANRDRDWVVAGDFNQEPADIDGLKAKVNGNVNAPPGPTRPSSNRTLDYAISKTAGKADFAGPWYTKPDHRAVYVDF